MASLRDIRPVLKTCGSWTFLRRVNQQMNEDGIYVWASALAYSWLFSIFPFLILLLSLLPYLPAHTKDSARQVVQGFIQQVLGKEAGTLNTNIDQVMNTPRKGWLGVGLVVSIWVASGGMSMTMSALDRCYDVKQERSYIHQRAVAIALTLGVTVGVLMLVLLLPIGLAVGSWAESQGILTRPLFIAFNAARYVLSMCFATAVSAVIYYFGPNIRQRFHIISPGTVFTAIVWILTDIVFRFYIDRYARYDQTYGTVGGAAILLLFFYIDGLVLLVGAEINSEIDFERLGVGPGTTTDFTGKTRQETLPEIAKEL
jgi:membrane protein